MCSLAGPAGQKAELQVANLLQFAVLSPSVVAAFAVANERSAVAAVAETVAAFVALVAATSAASKLASADCRDLTVAQAVATVLRLAAAMVKSVVAATLDVVALKHVAAATPVIALQQMAECYCFLGRRHELLQQLQMLLLDFLQVLMLQVGPDC